MSCRRFLELLEADGYVFREDEFGKVDIDTLMDLGEVYIYLIKNNKLVGEITLIPYTEDYVAECSNNIDILISEYVEKADAE